MKERHRKGSDRNQMFRFGNRISCVFFICLCTLILLSGCGGSVESETIEPVPEEKTPLPEGERYEVPEIEASYFNEEAAEYKNGAYIDTSNVSKGYVAVSAKSDARLKFVVVKEETYYYNLSSEGDVSIFPLQSGDGDYIFKVMENISENKYACLFETSATVTLEDEFQPYLRMNDYVNYTEDSNCVKIAKGFSAASATDLDVISQVYDYVCDNVTYDRDKAENVQSGYVPDPDETLATGKGICFDYASLAASMLRSQGIPTKLIFGYVAPNGVYHAWNMFYTKESGWVSVEFSANEEEWTRMDLTFSANGSDSQFIGDGSNYAEVYQY